MGFKTIKRPKKPFREHVNSENEDPILTLRCQNLWISPPAASQVTTLLVHPPPLALRQDEPQLSLYWARASSESDSAHLPATHLAAHLLYCTVQTSALQSSTAATHQYIALSQSLEASFNFWNKIPERKVSHHCGVAIESGDYVGFKTKVMSISSWSLVFLSPKLFCSTKYFIISRTEPILSLMSWSLVTDD